MKKYIKASSDINKDSIKQYLLNMDEFELFELYEGLTGNPFDIESTDDGWAEYGAEESEPYLTDLIDLNSLVKEILETKKFYDIDADNVDDLMDEIMWSI